MKFIPAASSIYIFASGVSSFLYPQLFVPLTASYVFSVGGYELVSFVGRRFGK